MNWGTKVKCPAAWLEIPITSALLFIAFFKSSFGVKKSFVSSTSKPKSANEEATTLAPLSCPSCPNLQTKILGALFSVLLNERDFIYYTGNITHDKSTKQYGRIVGNQFRTNGTVETINKIRKPLSSMTNKEKYYNNTRDKDFPQVYMYYAEISLLRRIETPSF